MREARKDGRAWPAIAGLKIAGTPAGFGTMTVTAALGTLVLVHLPEAAAATPVAMLGLVAVAGTLSLAAFRPGWPAWSEAAPAKPVRDTHSAVPRPTDSRKVPLLEDGTQVAAETLEKVPVLEREFTGFYGRAMLMRKARKHVASWMTLLVRGVELPVDGKLRKLQVFPPYKELTISGGGGEEAGETKEARESLPLDKLALKFDRNDELSHGGDLILAADGQERVVGLLSEAGMRNDIWVLGLALCLKALRGQADNGAGMGGWVERLPDELSLPPAAD